MACDISNGNNWLETMKTLLSCSIENISIEQIKTASIGLQIEELLCLCPDILDEDVEATCGLTRQTTLTRLFDRIKCGSVLSETEIQWAQANIYIKKTECCTGRTAEDPGDTIETVAAGIHTWAGGAATTDSITVVGLVATDIVIVNLVARAGSEYLVLAANDFANDQIDITLSANGTNGTTKLSYQVLRTTA